MLYEKKIVILHRENTQSSQYHEKESVFLDFDGHLCGL